MKFFQEHPEFVLISLAVFFSAILFISFFWGIKTLIVVLNRTTAVGNADQGTAASFNLGGARTLELKGILQQQ